MAYVSTRLESNTATEWETRGRQKIIELGGIELLNRYPSAKALITEYPPKESLLETMEDDELVTSNL